MQKFSAVYLREIRFYFRSVTAYVTISIFLALSGYFFYSIFRYYTFLSYQFIKSNTYSGSLNLMDGVIRPLMGNISIILLLVLPLLTMRLLAEEKKQGTFELLLTYPVSDFAVVMGKFISALTIYAMMLLGTLLYPLLLAVYSDPEILSIASCYIGLFLMGSSFLSMGIFFSSITDNQLVAGVATFGVALFFLIVGWAAPFADTSISKFLAQLSILLHFDSFSKGIIDSNDITYYLLLTFFFIFLTLRSLESTRWRS